MTDLLNELLQCSRSSPPSHPSGAGHWLTVTVPTELWAKIQAAAELTGLGEPRSSPQVRKQRAPAAQPLQAALVPDALLRISVVEQLTGLGESTIRRKMATADFPQPIKNGTRCTRWRAGEVTAWLREQGVAA